MSAESPEWKQHKDAGNDAYRSGNFEGAIEGYSKALQCDMPDSDRATVLSNRAQCRLRLENYDAAIEDCTACLTLDPENVKAMFRRAVAFEAVDRKNDAIQDFRNALQRNPTITDARAALRRLDPSAPELQDERPSQSRQPRQIRLPANMSQADMQSLAEAEERVRTVARQLAQARERRMVTMREKRSAELQRESVTALEETVSTYRAIGKMFLRTPRQTMLDDLRAREEEAARKLGVCDNTVEYLGRQQRSADEGFMDTVRSIEANARSS